MKKYLIEFTHRDGTIEEVELVTDRLEWSIDQWCRHRAVIRHKVVKEEITPDNKKMLFG